MSSSVSVLEIIPPPAFSDGKEEFLISATRSGLIIADNFIVPYFKQVAQPLKEISMQYPNELSDPKPLMPFQFSPNAVFSRLPLNYGLFSEPHNGNLVIVGHPSGQNFTSAVEMLPHLVWLIQPDRFHIQCRCRLCSSLLTPTGYGERAPPSKALPPVMNITSMLGSHGYPQGYKDMPYYSPYHPNPAYPPPTNYYNISPHIAPPELGMERNSEKSPYPSDLSESRDDLKLSTNSVENSMQLDSSQKIILKNVPPKTTYTFPLPSVNVRATEISAEDAKFRNKYIALKTENEQLEREINSINDAMMLARKKINRIKFERRLLLGAMSAGDPVTGKRARDGSSDESSIVIVNLTKPGENSEMEADTASELDDEFNDLDAYDSTPKTKQRKKKRTKFLDPNAPKRPANAFIMFCELQRECIKEERLQTSKIQAGSENDALLANLTKALGVRWRSLSEQDCQFYKEMFRIQVAQYDADIAQYKSEHPNAPLEDADTNNLPKNWSDPDAPKRPSNPFFVFCEMEDERIKAESQKERTKEEIEKELLVISKSLAERWRLLSEEDKKVYITRYNEEVAKYDEFMKNKMEQNQEGEHELEIAEVQDALSDSLPDQHVKEDENEDSKMELSPVPVKMDIDWNQK